MKKLIQLIPILLFLPIVLLGQEIKFETSVVTNSVALHPMIFDVDMDGENDIVVVDDYNDPEGNDATNIKTMAWFSYQGTAGGGGYNRVVISEINYRSCGIAHADIDNDGYTDIIGRYDIDEDGWPDIFISNAENSGYSICWYKNPVKDFGKDWEEHVIGYMDFAHTLQIADMDNDGEKDVVSGSLIIWNSPNPEGYHPVIVFVNKGNNLEWRKQIISEKGC